MFPPGMDVEDVSHADIQAGFLQTFALRSFSRVFARVDETGR